MLGDAWRCSEMIGDDWRCFGGCILKGSLALLDSSGFLRILSEFISLNLSFFALFLLFRISYVESEFSQNLRRFHAPSTPSPPLSLSPDSGILWRFWHLWNKSDDSLHRISLGLSARLSVCLSILSVSARPGISGGRR